MQALRRADERTLSLPPLLLLLLLFLMFPVLFFKSTENKRGGGEGGGSFFGSWGGKRNPNNKTTTTKSPQLFVNIPPEQREGGEKHFLITPLKNEAALTFQVPRQEMKVGNLSSASPCSRCYYGLPERFFYFFFAKRQRCCLLQTGLIDANDYQIEWGPLFPPAKGKERAHFTIPS